MQRPRTVAIAVGAGVLLGAYLAFWLHLLPYLAVVTGALGTVTILVLGAALGEDPQVSTRAFREAAPDLAGRLPDSADPREPASWSQPDGLGGGLPYDQPDAHGRGDADTATTTDPPHRLGSDADG